MGVVQGCGLRVQLMAVVQDYRVRISTHEAIRSVLSGAVRSGTVLTGTLLSERCSLSSAVGIVAFPEAVEAEQEWGVFAISLQAKERRWLAVAVE